MRVPVVRGPRRTLLVILATLLLSSGPAVSVLIDAPEATTDASSRIGRWSPPEAWPHSAVHAALLPDGNVLFWDNRNWYDVGWTLNAASVWNPTTGGLTDVSFVDPHKTFCSGHVVLADGRVLIAGGELGFANGHNATFLFDPATLQWSAGPPMKVGRYYPSLVTLPDGRVLVMAGHDVNGARNGPIEVLDPSSADGWQELTSAHRITENYPKLHVLPNGSLVRAGPERDTLFLDPTTGTWNRGPSSNEHREDGSSVLLPGLDRVLVLGGGDFPLASRTAEILELDGTPRWRSTQAMTFERRNQNAALLPDGDVLVVGGAVSGRAPVLAPELFDLQTETWTAMAPQASARTYHSTTLLLPDGRVLSAGGDTEFGFVPLAPARTMEVFSPPYLFRGPRPVIEDAPSHLDYGGHGKVSTPDADDVVSVVLVRVGSVTHSFGFDQRLVDVKFVRTSEGKLKIDGPPAPSAAPPGWYMLFLLNAEGVPSVARILSVG